ncbi:baseplate J/gp47 family protein [Bacillus horti]|uniref:Phage protein gp47/JayE n=1 Tax=Caldalkalibacillus horti TaxID=77523 RepID=A0ABT9W066_9BACI|nr:baseplate J/gp47 family protein [Bacillus horti]MDQ0166644.1 putative phage protein gp47/JayE [Bacillus horti]
MYQHLTYDFILNRMLGRVPNNIDKREGSIIYDALAPAAAELSQMYIELDLNATLSFADTATGEFLEKRTAEFGINRKPATRARRKGLFYGNGNEPIAVPIGSRFSIEDQSFRVVTQLSLGQYELEGESTGIVGNQQFGALLPITFIQGLVRAELTDILVPGEDAESDESLRQRFYDTVNEQPFGGNIADYNQKINSIQGVGGVKVFPTWQGGGTVRCTIIASDFSKPTNDLIDEVQTIIDPEINSGQGNGFAPIGHSVTIAGVDDVTIDIETTVILADEMTVGQVQADIENAIEEYLLTLRRSWKDEDRLIVRTAQIESRILTVSGVVDVSETRLNGSAANVELPEEQIPVRGQVLINGDVESLEQVEAEE